MEAFLADAALGGRIVYQQKQLAELLTGRVELEHLSENSFGSLVPARGYFHLKGFIDFVTAIFLLPLAVPSHRWSSRSLSGWIAPDLCFSVSRGLASRVRRITVYKFRTMRPIDGCRRAPLRQ